ncbi:MAG: hypothetical protein IAG13_11445 [Deltaproteobacteria bacterium]|nr:hypothetical protein [Nannocystaceae bacterium]
MKRPSLIPLVVCLGCPNGSATGDGEPTTSSDTTEGGTSSSTATSAADATEDTTGDQTASDVDTTSSDPASTSGSSGTDTRDPGESSDSSTTSDDGGSSASASSESTGAACVEEPAASDWSCLPENEGPAFSSGSALVHVIVQDFLATPIAAAMVRVCTLDDADCDAPLDEGTTNAMGDAPVSVPRDIAVFFDILAPGYVPMLVFPWDPPPADDDEVALVIPNPTPAQLAGVFEDIGAEADPSRGHLNVAAFDCSTDPTPAAGVAVELSTADASTIIGAPTTEEFGSVYVGNVPTGPAVVQGVVVPLCDEAMGAQAIHVRAGTVSMIDLFPSPTP